MPKPRKKDPKTFIMKFAVSEKERTEIMRRANLHRRTLSNFARWMLIDARVPANEEGNK